MKVRIQVVCGVVAANSALISSQKLSARHDSWYKGSQKYVVKRVCCVLCGHTSSPRNSLLRNSGL